MNRQDYEKEKSISDIAGCFSDPLVVYPGGWHESLPKNLTQAITVERMIELMKAHRDNREPVATDAECCAYLYTANLCGPMDHDWAQLFLYLAGKYLRDHEQRDVPEDLQVTKLTDWQIMLLTDMKHDIYRARVRKRNDNDRDDRRERKIEEKQKVAEKQSEFKQLELTLF